MRLTEAQIDFYRQHGYLILKDVFREEDLRPVTEAVEAHLDERARQLHAEGKLSELHASEPFERRYALLYAQSREIGSNLDIMKSKLQALFDFLRNERLLDVAGSLLGEELTCNPIQHLRAKVPAGYAGTADTFQNVPWHQDAGVTLEEADDSEIITFWLPLVDAMAETGCMEIMPDVFRQGQLEHQAAGGTTIVPEQLPDRQPVLAECPKGGLIVMNKYTPHRGTPNVSGIVRWSIDLRYQRTGEPTGRPFHPAFPVRSASRPETVERDYDGWKMRWDAALKESAGQQLHRVK
ncbi:phytanoyl-CoA dioxygenase family protein [Paenibacillus sp. IB182496]|uniref:Phytanoyl-CoA dioxygenase family protein n=1 Tax=Paenibacillus sabuli TaxID=2772509 RepID=A0A927BNH2_9BACL|nr:phytanoyl-CoA dioxygenase family protein [Paenibacillus sabuli]MBD2843776.1 phytanoyl-CoA dioxygenase family protein [Paenibacillus sabuli]